MTVIMPFRRVATRFTPRTSILLTRLNTPASSIYASCQCANNNTIISRLGDAKIGRSLSSSASFRDDTLAQKPVSRPKAHTGRATARTIKKSTGSADTGSNPKKTTKKATGKPKAVGRPRTKPKKAAKPKPVKKPKVSTSKRAKSIAALQERKDLKAKALLNQPKKLPENAYAVYFSEGAEKGLNMQQSAERIKARGSEWRSLAPAELERLNHIAVQNRKRNEAAYSEWISQFTPLQVKEANEARQKILEAKKPSTRKSGQKPKVSLLHDDRLVRRPRNAFTLFNTDRWASGDFKNFLVKDAVKLIAKEWKELSATEREEYKSRGQADVARYEEQMMQAYGRTIKKDGKDMSKSKSTTPSA